MRHGLTYYTAKSLLTLVYVVSVSDINFVASLFRFGASLVNVQNTSNPKK